MKIHIYKPMHLNVHQPVHILNFSEFDVDNEQCSTVCKSLISRQNETHWNNTHFQHRFILYHVTEHRGEKLISGFCGEK